MRIPGVFVLFTLLISTAPGQPGSVAAAYQPKGPIRDYFLGAWKLVGTEIRYPDGHTAPYADLGAGAVGFLLYTPSGHMCAQLMKPTRPAWADSESPTAEEARSALDGFTSYCGTFEVRAGERTMIHRPETAWSPGWVGSVQRRPYHLVSETRFFFRGDEVVQQKDGTKATQVWTITWERLPVR